MATPAIRVEIGLDLGSKDTQAMVLDDPTKGLLDGSYYLSGYVFHDISNRTNSVSVTRGKSQALDRIDAGVVTITAHNNDRAFDPLYEPSPFYGVLIPRRQLRISANGYPIFYGYIDDFDISYNGNISSTVTIRASDAFSVLANALIEEFDPAVELPGQRITTILDRPEVDWDADLRDIDPGITELLDTTVAQDTPALQYLQLVADSELGNLFLSKDGKVTFRGQDANPYVTTTILTDQKTGDIYNGIKYQDISVVYGSENLYNKIIASNSDVIPEEAIAENPDSQLYYGVRTLAESNLLVLNPTDLQALADQLLARFSQPQYRFEAINVLLDDLTLAEQASVLDLEIGDIITVQFEPSSIPPVITQPVRIIGISHQWRPYENIISFALERLDTGLFILDNELFGVLDQNALS